MRSQRIEKSRFHRNCSLNVSGSCRAAEVFHVALLQLVVVARDIGIEGHALRQPVQSEALQNLIVFRLRLDVLERFERLEHGRPRIVHSAAPVVLVLVDGGFARGVAIGMAVVEREVRGVDGGRMALVLDAHAHVREREIAVGRARHGNRLDAVALVLVGSGVERVVEAHIGVERIVFRARFLFRNRIVERCRHLRLFGEEFAEFDRSRDAVGLVIVFRPRGNALFQAAEALGSVSTLHIHRAEVGKLHIQVALRRPTAFVVVLLQAQFVDPNLTRFFGVPLRLRTPIIIVFTSPSEGLPMMDILFCGWSGSYSLNRRLKRPFPRLWRDFEPFSAW